jgi:hypothetical protein
VQAQPFGPARVVVLLQVVRQNEPARHFERIGSGQSRLLLRPFLIHGQEPAGVRCCLELARRALVR